MGSRILKELHDTAKDMHDIGTIDTTLSDCLPSACPESAGQQVA